MNEEKRLGGLMTRPLRYSAWAVDALVGEKVTPRAFFCPGMLSLAIHIICGRETTSIPLSGQEKQKGPALLTHALGLYLFFERLRPRC